jgi:hypothetical protein
VCRNGNMLVVAAIIGASVVGGETIRTGVAQTLPEKASPQLTTIRVLDLRGEVPQIDQVVPLPEGGFVARDSDFESQERQGVFLYDSRGAFLKRIAGYGLQPGQFNRLMSVAVDNKGNIWAANAMPARVARFSSAGKLLGSNLVPNLAMIFSLGLDPPRNALYVGGFLPLHIRLDKTCLLVHQYAMSGVKYRESFVRTDPDVLSKHQTSLEYETLDVDKYGRVWAADAPVMKLWCVDPKTKRQEFYKIISHVAAPPGLTDPFAGTEYLRALARNASLIRCVLALNPFVVVALNRPNTKRQVLEIFDMSGGQVGVDIEPPGRLVGKTGNGHALFLRKNGKAAELVESVLTAVR